MGEHLESRALLSLVPQLVADLNPGPAGIYVQGPITEMGGFAYFSGGYGVGDYELWKSDGTTPGTVLVKDINPGNAGSSPKYLTNINGTLYFSADDGIHGRELWTSDGTTAGTVLLRDISSSNSNPHNFTNVNGTVFFTATSGSGRELWKTNGTSAGTQLVKDINTVFSSSDPDELTNFNGTLFFRANDDFEDYQLWKSDGTSTGTVKLTSAAGSFRGLYPDNLAVVGTNLFFTVENSDGAELWKSTGTAAGTVEVTLIDAGITGASSYQFTNVNGILYFTPPLADGELWRSNGTAAGTFRVADIYPGFHKSSPTFLTAIGTTLFFAANDGTHGAEPWISNGTAAGTTMLGDLQTGAAGSSPGWFKFINGSVAFAADSTPGLGQLWQSPGPGATVLVKDQIQAISQGVRYLTDIGLGRLIFAVNDGANGLELWASNGTGAGTGKIVRDATTTDGSGIDEFVQIGSTLIFSGFDTAHGHELWRSDGTAGGTSVTDIIPGPGSASPASLVNLNGTLLFSANDGATGDELWSMNVATGAATLVKDIAPGSVANSSNPAYLTNVNGTVYFAANDGTHGVELWKTDGTAAGTSMVADLVSGVNGSTPTMLTNFNGQVVFAIDDVLNFSSGLQVLISDGTAAGTKLLAGFSNSSLTRLLNLTIVGNKLYFMADNPLGNAALWTSDGTSAGTVQVATWSKGAPATSKSDWLTNVNGTVFFTANDGTHGTELWRTDGTPGGTFQVKDINSGSPSSSPQQLTNVSGILYFTANDGITGAELWRSDGTAAGTGPMKDISATGSGPSELTNIGGLLFFSADGGTGRELWKSDGSAFGTSQLFEIAAGAASSSPAHFFRFGRQVLFTADDQAHGSELWSASEINAPPIGLDQHVTFPEDAALVLDFRGNFADPNNVFPDNLLGIQVVAVSGLGTLTDNGAPIGPNQFIPVADIAAHSVDYTPPPDAYGNALFKITFKVKDDGGTANGGSDLAVAANTFTFNYTPVNDPPSGADGAATVLDHLPYKFSFDEFGFSDSHDAPSNALLSVKINAVAGNGSLSLNGATISPGQFVPKSGSNLVFTPGATDFNSQAKYATITFQLKDTGGTANGGIDLDPTVRTLTLNLQGTHSAPSGKDKSITIAEDGAYSFTSADFGFSDPGDSPADSFLGATIVSAPAQGVLKLGAGAVKAGDFLSFAQLSAATFEPAANSNGISYAKFTFQVQDDGGTANSGIDLDPTPRTITISVTEVNDPPVGADDSLSSAIEDSAARTIAFAVLLVNDSPGPANESGQTLTIPAVGGAVGGSVSIVGTNVIFTPAADYNGPASFWYTVRDNGTSNGIADFKSSMATVSFTISEMNDLPVVLNSSLPAVAEDSATQTIALAPLLANDSPGPPNESGQVLSIIDVGGAVGGTVSLVGTSAIFTPTADYNGLASFTYTVRDDGTTNGVADSQSSVATVSFNITEINDPPGGVDDGLAARPEDSGPWSIAFATLLANDSKGPTNESGQVLTITEVSGSVGGTVALDGPNNSVVFMPTPDYNGPASFTYTLEDNGQTDGLPDFKTSTALVTFNIDAVNDRPTFTKGVDETATDESPAQIVSDWATNLAPGPLTATDEASQQLHFRVTNDKNELFADQPAIDDAGALTFTPAPNAHGTAIVTVLLQDNAGTANGGADMSIPQLFNITITKLHAWHNVLHALDVTNSAGTGTDGTVAPGDALAIINYINSHGSGPVPMGSDSDSFGFLDTSDSSGNPKGDNFVAPNDALAVINWINSRGAPSGPDGEGEASQASQPAVRAAQDDVLSLLAADIAEQSVNRRRLRPRPEGNWLAAE